MRIFDNLRNALTGQGTGRDVRAASTYGTALMLNQQQIAAAYRGSGLLRKIIQIPALDMVREWRDWKLEAEQITLVEAEEKRLGIRQKIRQAEVLRGLGGGALILGLPGDPTQPPPKTAGKGGLAFVHVVSRWHLTFSRTQDDARLDGYGEPLMWQMTTSGGQTSIHPSRVIPFRADTAGAMISITMDAQDRFWGESTLQQVLDAVQDSDTARASFAALLHKARLLRIGIPGLIDMVASGQQSVLQDRLAILATAESIHNATIFDAGDSEGKGGEVITDTTYNFAGAKDVINAYGEFVAAISDIPATRLLGRAPEGMNSSGDSQQRDWEKRIRAMQTLDLAPCLDRLDRYLIPSALGSMPDGQWFDFAPLSLPSEAEETTRFKTLVESLQIVANMAVMPDRAFNEATQNALIETGMMPGLDTVLASLSEEERFGVEADPEGDLDEDPEEGGDPTASAGEGAAGLEANDPPRRAANDASPRTLYVQRKLLNAAELIDWAKAQGFETTTPADELHCTVLYSKQAVDWMKMGSDWHGDDKGELIVPAGGARIVEPLGGKGAVVLLFASSALCWRHEEMVRNGASHDFPEYQPHVTITYAKPEGLDLAAVEPFRGVLRFGPEVFEEIKDGRQPSEA